MADEGVLTPIAIPTSKPLIDSKLSWIAMLGLLVVGGNKLLEYLIGTQLIPNDWMPLVLAVQSALVFVIRRWFTSVPIAGILRRR